jgi:APA family basic amino acid/polyamine antiporter
MDSLESSRPRSPELSAASPDAGQLVRALGPWSATSIVIGAIIGTGIFFTPKEVALIAGSANLALWTWILAAGIVVCGALSFAELGAMYPQTGGQYTMLRDAYHPGVGFLYVLSNAVVIQAGAIAVIAYWGAQYLGVAVRGAELRPETATIIGAILIVVLVITNSVGVVWGAAVQNATVIAKLATLGIVVALALVSEPAADAFGGASTQPAAPAETALWDAYIMPLLAALAPVMFSFGGWQHALWIAGEIKEPRTNVPRAILLGVGIVTVVYLAVNWAYLHLLGYERVCNSQALAADAVSRVWPELGKRFVAGAIAVSAFGVLNAQLLSGPRLVCGLARDGRFFAVFGRVVNPWKTPLAAIVLLGGVGLAMLLIAGASRMDQVASGVVLIDSLFFLLTGLALLVLRRRRPAASRPVRVPLYPVVPILFVLGELAVIVGTISHPKYRQNAYIGAIWIAIALAMYLVMFRRRRSDSAGEDAASAAGGQPA